MDIENIARFIAEVTALPGVPGYEAGVNGRIAEWFRPLADDVFKDDLENLYARVGAQGNGPRVGAIPLTFTPPCIFAAWPGRRGCGARPC